MKIDDWVDHKDLVKKIKDREEEKNAKNEGKYISISIKGIFKTNVHVPRRILLYLFLRSKVTEFRLLNSNKHFEFRISLFD